MEQLAVNKERVLAKYIDMIYFYTNERYDFVKDNLDKILSGDQSVIPFNFRLFNEKGEELSREDVFKTLQLAISESLTEIGDLELFIIDVVDTNNQRRFNGELPVAVENAFQDKIYFNHQMLKYLRQEFGPVRNVFVVLKNKIARSQARRDAEVMRKEYPGVEVDYSKSEDILFKEYYLKKYEEKYRTKEEYAMERSKVEAVGLTPASYSEFVYNSINARMKLNNYTRGRKL